MDIFVIALVVFSIGGSYAAGELTITQAPNPVGSKGNVTLTCSGVGIRPKDLIWKDSNGEVMEAGKTLGVETIMERPKSRDLVLNMQNFTSEATVSCEVEDKELRQNFSICVLWGIIHPPENITIHKGDDGPKSMNCKVVQDCETFVNPWVDEKGEQVRNNTDKGIEVTSDLVPGTSKVVEWNLTFTKLSIEELPTGTYTCRVPNDTANAMLKMAESWIVRPPPSVTTVSKADINKTLSCLVAEDGTDHPNPWFDQDKKQVTDDSERGITVTSNLVPGTSTAVEWKLTFTNLSQEVIPNTGVSYTCKGSHSTATAMLNRAKSWIVRPPPSVTTVSKVDIDKTLSCLVAEDGVEPLNPWYDQDGEPVNNDTGIEVTSTTLPGIGTVYIVEWKLTFTNPLEQVILDTAVNYTCKGSHSNANATLKMADSPTIKILLNDLIVQKGSPVPKSMICVVIGDYNTSILNPWTRKGVSISNDSVVTVEDPQFEPDLVVYQLTFRDVTDEAKSYYTCAASNYENCTAALIVETSGNDQSTTNEMSSSRPIPTSSLEPLPSIPDEEHDMVTSALSAEPPPPTPTPPAESTSAPPPTPTPPAVLPTNSTVIIPDVPSPNTTSIAVQPLPTSPEPTSVPSTPVGILGIAITVVVLVILCGAVYLVYWKRHMLRDWLMDKDVVKVIKKQKRGKGYKYSKLPRDITTSMKHLE